MKDKIFGVLQRVGRSFMLPIAILPVAGLLLGIGSSFTKRHNDRDIRGWKPILGEGTVLNALLTIMSSAGNIIFDNLPIIFAVGVAIGMAKKEKEVAALAAMIAFFVMNATINGMLNVMGDILADGSLAPDVLSGTVVSVCGIQTLQMGVFGGIIVGLGVAALHNRFHKIVLPNALSFFGGFTVCADYLNRCVSVCGNSHVFHLAGCSERHFRPGRPCNGNRIPGNPDFRNCQEGADSIRTAPCILSAVLADSCRRNDGWWTGS